MLSFAGKMVSTETAFSNQLLINRVHSFILKQQSSVYLISFFGFGGNSTKKIDGIVNLQNRNCIDCINESRQHTLAPFVQACSLGVTENLNSSLNSKLPKMASPRNNEVQIFATRRRRMAYSRTETYVLLEPGQDEKFVSEDELKAKLKDLLENWPGKALPRDLARFPTIDEAVSFLLSSVCELELDGDIGSIQWYEVRLE
ncbi:hypothetical protein Patl1_21744 [Pistacia atlantica]|uniref:Uncharacterized protein n=1 Tax=Pistacia atlantica TaxID=434234 RepID=A0ACC1BK38_9ROSI|nr:hypothetical protein Patl1_21744 [Pistacia atlantica]